MQCLSQQNGLERKQLAEIELEKSERTRGCRNGLESRTAGMAFFVIARIVRVTGCALRRSVRFVLMVIGIRVFVARTVVRMAEQKLGRAMGGDRKPSEEREQRADSQANPEFQLLFAAHSPVSSNKVL